MSPEPLLLRLRALLGVNARCEILAYLLLNRRGSPRAVAQASALRRVLEHDALAGLARSGLPVAFGGAQQHAGRSLLPFFVGQLREVLDGAHRLG